MQSHTSNDSLLALFTKHGLCNHCMTPRMGRVGAFVGAYPFVGPLQPVIRSQSHCRVRDSPQQAGLQALHPDKELFRIEDCTKRASLLAGRKRKPQCVYKSP